MKHALLLLSFPCLMLILTLAISYLSARYRRVARPGRKMNDVLPNAQIQYYSLPPVDEAGAIR